MRTLLTAVIVMAVMILLGTAGLVSVMVRRAMQRPVFAGACPSMPPRSAAGLSAGGRIAEFALAQPPGTRIASVTRQSDNLLAVTLSGGGADRLLVWDVAAGRVVAKLTLTVAP